MNTERDTIVAQATPPGRGGISIVRISGPQVREIAQALLGSLPSPRSAQFSSFVDEQGQVIDQGIALYFQQPHSFTSEDILELHGHGGPVIVDLLMRRILNLGARMARPGEFSERAFLNGKIDLAQAEAIADLIQASTEQAARSAIRSLQGEFSNKINQLVEAIIQLRLYLEAAIDFVDEEIDFLSDETIKQRFVQILKEIDEIQKSAKQGSLLREGLNVVIVGKPNVGKSTLLNILSGKELAIVTDIPGTTRDALREQIQIDGIPLHIVDTAGLRETQDPIEQEGIRRTRKEITQADIILHMIDAHASPIEAFGDKFCWERGRGEGLDSNIPTIIIRNKIDLLNEKPSLIKQDNTTIVSLSAKANDGLHLLKEAIHSLIGFSTYQEGIFSARQRHLNALHQAKSFLQIAFQQLCENRTIELIAEDLRQTQKSLTDITGEFTTDDLLGRIFSSFCIGK